MKSILIVEDDRALGDGLCLALKSPEAELSLCRTLSAARAALGAGDFDLLVLDVNLPDGSGLNFLRRHRDGGGRVPVILLTANDMETDIVAGLESGADDYVTKPFSIQVLKRRVEAVLRRGAAGTDCFDDGFLRLDFQALTAARNGERLSITPNEYKLLRLLTANAGAVMTRRLLLEKLWDSGGNFIDDHTLTVTMNRLRAKIEDAGHPYIQTVRGMGYVWTGAQE